MAETIKEVAFYCILGSTFHHAYCNGNRKCNIRSLSVEINLRKRNCFLNCSYNSRRNTISSHLECLNRIIDEHSKTYDNFGDFNVLINKNYMKMFCDINV